jgi:hypothetical protein
VVSLRFGYSVLLYAKEIRLTFLGLILASSTPPTELTPHPVYNSFLGLLVLIKGITTYRRELLRRNHSRLWEIIVRYDTRNDTIVDTDTNLNASGSFHYYLIITVVNISTLYISGYGDDGYSNVSFNCVYT